MGNNHLLDKNNLIKYKYILSILTALLFSVYGPQFDTELPHMIRIVFSNGFPKFIIILFIVYLGNDNLQMSLFISILIILIVSMIDKHDIKNSYNKQICN